MQKAAARRNLPLAMTASSGRTVHCGPIVLQAERLMMAGTLLNQTTTIFPLPKKTPRHAVALLPMQVW
jgi:hypothetical protein